MGTVYSNSGFDSFLRTLDYIANQLQINQDTKFVYDKDGNIVYNPNIYGDRDTTITIKNPKVEVKKKKEKKPSNKKIRRSKRNIENNSINKKELLNFLKDNLKVDIVGPSAYSNQYKVRLLLGNEIISTSEHTIHV